MTPRLHYYGMFTIPQTPFTDAGLLDIDSLRREFDFCIETGDARHRVSGDGQSVRKRRGHGRGHRPAGIDPGDGPYLPSVPTLSPASRSRHTRRVPGQ
ncbi:MAG: hypothetical protein VYA69_11970 [Gemmatimonadota bacterium]|nr:hypothetical protein [Gemmatimonadota bacterium]